MAGGERAETQSRRQMVVRQIKRKQLLWAVPVEAHHFDEEETLDFAAQFGRGGKLVGDHQWPIS